MTDSVNTRAEKSETSLLKYRIKFLALVSVFILPFIASWLAFYVFDYRPVSKNYGELVLPVRKLDLPVMSDMSDQAVQQDFWNRWTFVILQKGDCDELCRNNLHYLRQMRIALGRDMDRVQNVLMLDQAVSPSLVGYLRDFPQLTVFDNVNKGVFDRFDLPQKPVGESALMYLVDPDQNLMMIYPAVHDPSSVLSDLRRLLKLSQIG